MWKAEGVKSFGGFLICCHMLLRCGHYNTLFLLVSSASDSSHFYGWVTNMEVDANGRDNCSWSIHQSRYTDTFYCTAMRSVTRIFAPKA